MNNDAKNFVCERCSAHVVEGVVVFDHDPETWDNPSRREMLESIARAVGAPEREKITRPYHRLSHFHNHQTQTYLCGPLHEETEQERFVRWCQNGGTHR